MSTSRSPLVRGLLIAVAVLLVLVVAGVVLVRRALSPETLQPMLESQLTTLLGRPVTVGGLDISLLPFPSVWASDISIGSGGEGKAPSLGLASVRVQPKLSSVLSSPIVIERIELDGLALSVRRDADGKWQLPFGGASAAAGDAAGSSPARAEGSSAGGPPEGARGASDDTSGSTGVEIREIQLRGGRVAIFDEVLRSPSGSDEVAVIDAIAASMSREAGSTKLEHLTASLGSSKLTGAATAGAAGLTMSLQWLDIHSADLPQLFGLLGASAPEGLQVEGHQPLQLDLAVAPGGDVSVTGKLAAERIAFGTLTVTKVEAPLRFADRTLTVAPTAFEVYQGKQQGRFVAALGAAPASWQLATDVEGVDLNALLSANTSMKDTLVGTARVSAELQGRVDLPLDRAASGTVSVAVGKGAIKNFPLLAALNSAIGLTAGSGKDTEFDGLTGSFGVGGGRARTSDLRLRMGELQVLLVGSLGFDQTLDFKGTCVLSREKSQELSARMSDLSAMKNRQGEIELPLTIRGTFSDPNIGVEVGKILKRAAEKELERQIKRGLGRLRPPN